MELLFEKALPGMAAIFSGLRCACNFTAGGFGAQERFAAAGTFGNGNQPPLYCACKPRARRKQRVLPAGQLHHEIQPAH